MKRLVAVTSCPTGIAHTMMAAEALKRAAAAMGHQINVETQGSVGTRDQLSAQQIADADVVLLASDIRVERSRFVGKLVHEVRTSDAIRNTNAVIEAALAPAPTPFKTTPSSLVSAPVLVSAKRLVAITSCPTGIAHTFMAAESLQKAA